MSGIVGFGLYGRRMHCHIRDVTVHYVEHGTGMALVALHGAGVDHREIEAGIEAAVPATGLRRIYPDLPGMGSTTSYGLASNEDVVTMLGDFIDQVSDGPVLLLGHSYGAYLARGVAARRPHAVLGLALLCPVGGGSPDLPEHHVVRADADVHDELEPALRAGFDEYFVVRTAATARRYRDHVAPGTTTADEDALGRIFAGWPIDMTGTCAAPALIVAGRHDATAGYAHAARLLDDYPRATLAVVEDAGHALMHEQPELLGALLADWLRRIATDEGKMPL